MCLSFFVVLPGIGPAGNGGPQPEGGGGPQLAFARVGSPQAAPLFPICGSGRNLRTLGGGLLLRVAGPSALGLLLSRKDRRDRRTRSRAVGGIDRQGVAALRPGAAAGCRLLRNRTGRKHPPRQLLRPAAPFGRKFTDAPSAGLPLYRPPVNTGTASTSTAP